MRKSTAKPVYAASHESSDVRDDRGDGILLDVAGTIGAATDGHASRGVTTRAGRACDASPPGGPRRPLQHRAVWSRTVRSGGIASEDAAKALRIEILYERDWRRPQVVWHRELVPRLERAGAGHLESVFAPLRRGDIVLIEYAPRKGTTVRINRSIAVLGAQHELMLAFLDHWLGQRPVSEDVKRALLGRS